MRRLRKERAFLFYISSSRTHNRGGCSPRLGQVIILANCNKEVTADRNYVLLIIRSKVMIKVSEESANV